MTREPWTVARYLGREKRFTVHAELPDGARVAAHTNNTGRLSGCGEPGARCWLSPAADPRRRLAWTLEVMEAPAWPTAWRRRRRRRRPCRCRPPRRRPGRSSWA